LKPNGGRVIDVLRQLRARFHRSPHNAVVTDQPKPVRARRRAGSTVAVTGAASGLGRAAVEHLASSDGVRRVVGIDVHRADVAGVTWRLADVRDPLVGSRLDGVDSVVHLANDLRLDAAYADRRALNVRGTGLLLTAAAAAGVRRVVLVTSTMVYGALPDNPLPLAEDAPVRAGADVSLVGDWVEIERLARQARRAHPALDVTVLRPAILVGPEADSMITRLFEAPRLLTLRHARTAWQFCHVEDLLSALSLAATGSVSGAVAVASTGWLEQADVERITGLRPLVLPPTLALATAERLQRVGVLTAPASELPYLSAPWAVECRRLAEAGWAPAYSNEAALEAHVAMHGEQIGRGLPRLDRRDATRAAAGATVALAGTVALARARAARRRRRG
jgi:nucleoside-diphosphate-sugar epimerase